MKLPMDVLAVLCACLLPVMSIVAQNETVTGCDGHLCSTGRVNTLPLASRVEAVILSRCHAFCLNNVSFKKQ